MLEIAFVALLAVMAWVFPRGVKYFIVAPLCGIALGGVAWSVMALIGVVAVGIAVFGYFLAAGILFAEVAAYSLQE